MPLDPRYPEPHDPGLDAQSITAKLCSTEYSISLTPFNLLFYHRATPIQQPSCGFIKNLSRIRTPIFTTAVSLPSEDLQVTPEAPVRFSWSLSCSGASKGRRSTKRSLRKHVILVPSN
ncbi:hypothetical protein KC19_5G014100 [Ceratodon purpureus]|uniref:Uncharacterized protein n=1 Tax=Ceratodon purpureus TaxID=3225 RepID=A0A8T0HZ14_CERPU|nr:hypothetical protein KC19_5G014100 [Ceratodon purpureus]